MIIDQFIFFIDDDDWILMFYRDNLKRKPLGAYGVEELLIEVVFNNEWIWTSEDMKYNIQCILEADLDQGYSGLPCR